MAAKKKTDQYVSILGHTTTASAANTRTFSEITIGLNLFDKVGLRLSRIEYEPSGTTLADIDNDSDVLRMALSTSNNITSLSILETEIVDAFSIMRLDGGAAANMVIQNNLFIHDFSTLPGGGILIAPKPLYGAIDSTGLTIAAEFNIRLYFTIVNLSDSEYIELIETRRAFG